MSNVPEGWKLVPVEPTDEMYSRCDNERLAKIYWRKLIAAAPPAPTISAPANTGAVHVELVNELRMYAEDLHSRHGHNGISSCMSKAADALSSKQAVPTVTESINTEAGQDGLTDDEIISLFTRFWERTQQGDRSICPDDAVVQFARNLSSKQAASVKMPEGLHPATANLVIRFATALAEKLHNAEQKYGYSDGWLGDDWLDECRYKLIEHIAKGDPRDVAAYCAFLWHHGASTHSANVSEAKPSGELKPLPEPVQWFIDVTTNGRSTGRYEVCAEEFRDSEGVVPLFTADQMREYALANRGPDHIGDANKMVPAKLCKYGNEKKSCTSSPMDCQCVLDATFAMEPDDQFRDATKMIPAEVKLPVVAYIRYAHNDSQRFLSFDPSSNESHTPLTDHATATAELAKLQDGWATALSNSVSEIAKRDAEIERLGNLLNCQDQEIEQLRHDWEKLSAYNERLYSLAANLQEERDRWYGKAIERADELAELDGWKTDAAELRTKLAEAEKDAGRYRWLREKMGFATDGELYRYIDGYVPSSAQKAETDATIDAAKE